jgi:hypothetical protein
LPIYEGTITFRFLSPSQRVAELYIDGVCTALRYNKPEVAPSSVQWNLSEASDDLHRTEAEYFAEEFRRRGSSPPQSLTEQAKLIEPADGDD